MACHVLRCLLLALLIAPAARAGERYEIPDELLRLPSLPDGDGARDAWGLTLSEAIQSAVRANLGIQLRREQATVAAHFVRAARGRFEPGLNLWYSHSDADTPPSVTLLQQGIARSQLNVVGDSWNASLSERLPIGTQLGLQFTNLRTLSSTRDAQLDFPMLHNTGLSLQVTQPLLRGFFFDLDIPRADLLRARFGSARAREDVRVVMLATVRATEDAYWDLVQALKVDEIQRASLALAVDQLRLTQKQIEAGILPPSDSIAAESTLAQRELVVLEADTAIAQAADRLRLVLNLPRAEWSRALLPIDPPHFEEPHVDVAEATERALKNRPEIAQRTLDVQRAALDVRAARVDRLPQLDVAASYGIVGQRVGYDEALGQLGSGSVRAFTVSANFSWSPLMLAARSQVDALIAAQRAAGTQLDQQRNDLSYELRDNMRTLDAAGRQVRAAARSRDLARRALDAEQRRFANGTSNNFFVAQRQANLAQAQLSELMALIRHQKAETALEASMGVLLEVRGIRLDVPNG